MFIITPCTQAVQDGSLASALARLRHQPQIAAAYSHTAFLHKHSNTVELQATLLMLQAGRVASSQDAGQSDA